MFQKYGYGKTLRRKIRFEKITEWNAKRQSIIKNLNFELISNDKEKRWNGTVSYEISI
jgi:hypothetical protein